MGFDEWSRKLFTMSVEEIISQLGLFLKLKNLRPGGRKIIIRQHHIPCNDPSIQGRLFLIAMERETCGTIAAESFQG
jgi:hypothetical protein